MKLKVAATGCGEVLAEAEALQYAFYDLDGKTRRRVARPVGRILAEATVISSAEPVANPAHSPLPREMVKWRPSGRPPAIATLRPSGPGWLRRPFGKSAPLNRKLAQ